MGSHQRRPGENEAAWGVSQREPEPHRTHCCSRPPRERGREKCLSCPLPPALLSPACASHWLILARSQVSGRLRKYPFIALAPVNHCFAICSNLYKPESDYGVRAGKNLDME